MTSRWWVRLPRACVRLSRALGFALADGHFLVAVPPIGSWGPPVLAALGFTAGALTLGYERVFSEALWIVLLATLAGFLATGLGVAFVAGFATGDFLLGQRRWALASPFGGVQIDDLTGVYARDAAAANRAVGLPRTPEGYTWHHVEDGRTMILIPRDLHQGVPHTGGAAVIRNGGFDPPPGG